MSEKYVILSKIKDFKYFVKCWSRLYYDANEDLYNENIRKNTLKIQDMIQLYTWKNPGILSGPKKNIVNKIEMRQLNQMRGNAVDNELRNNICNFTNGIIWKAFLLHIIYPSMYPIFDQHAYRAYKYICSGVIWDLTANTKDKSKCYVEYKQWFNNKIKELKIKPRQLDKALWVFGKFLSFVSRNNNVI